MPTDDRSKVVATRITPDAHRRLRILAAHTDRKLSDLLDEGIEIVLRRAEKKAAAEQSA